MSALAPKSRVFAPDWRVRIGWILLLAYVIYAASLLEVTWERFMIGILGGGRLIPSREASTGESS